MFADPLVREHREHGELLRLCDVSLTRPPFHSTVSKTKTAIMMCRFIMPSSSKRAGRLRSHSAAQFLRELREQGYTDEALVKDQVRMLHYGSTNNLELSIHSVPYHTREPTRSLLHRTTG